MLFNGTSRIKYYSRDLDLSPEIMAVLFIALGTVLICLLMGGSLQPLLSSSIKETPYIKTKQKYTYIVVASDGIPRTIENCPFSEGDSVTITYKQGLPTLEGFQNQDYTKFFPLY